MQVLAGDVGGTKVWLQIAEVSAGRYRVLHERRYYTAGYEAMQPMIREFIQTLPANFTLALASACLGVAGPISPTAEGQRASLTNLPWDIDTAWLGRELGCPKVRLVNDFQAAGYGIEALQADDLTVLQRGTPRERAPCAIIGAGTGLGQGILFWERDHYEVLATEGGHVDFGPTDELQVELWRYLKRHFERVSYERVVSGPGIINIHNFLREHGGRRESEALAAAMDAGDPAAAITQAALAGTDELAVQTLDLFVRAYGAQAGNFALTTLPRGGLYIAGGIAPRIIDKLTDGAFMRAFLDKGRMSALAGAIPVRVVTNPKVGLMGAALAASRL